MSQENPQECAEPVEPKAEAAPEKTSDYYRVSEQLPVRTKEVVSIYRTSNQTYGSRAPTVHEMPKVFYPHSNKFSRQLSATGMFRNNTFNVFMERSVVTGPDNYITHCDRLNFHPSYNVNRPSICD
uniref:UPF0691 protein C9orf116 homolog isoform X2 n=1 Tax=Jaculus jaculus TaxID=51337 RepID=UPI001E1B4311|nr:UPF0691 protein C9orf116 homolog isoform X2 [Jaculus jaculus]